VGSVPFGVREATAGDAPAVAALFYHTILNVNVGDYSVSQVEAWAGPAPDPNLWEGRMSGEGGRSMYVATVDGRSSASRSWRGMDTWTRCACTTSTRGVV
jgi:hypothetical protein